MKHYFNIVLAVLLLASACRPARKVQVIEEAISRKDTAATVVITQTPQIDSVAVVSQIVEKVNLNRVNFKTFSAKVKLDYESQDQKDGGTAHIRLEKDKQLWVSLTGALGVEGFRLMVTPDSVVLMNKLKKTVQYRTIEYLQEMTDIPFDFATLQDLIVGNPIFLEKNVVSYKNTGSELLVLVVGNLYKNLLTLDNADFKILHSKLDDVDVNRNRTCAISYNNYETIAGFPFATKRVITVAEKGRLVVELEFKQYAFNTELTFPFNVPKNYKRK